MMLSNGRLVVHYKADQGADEINDELDSAIENVLKEFGYTRDGSGVTLATGVRDISFRKKESG